MPTFWLSVLVWHQAHVKLLEVADSVSLEEVNAIGASVLSYISHYRNEAALLEEVGPDPVSKGYARPGPSRMTSIVACVPAFMDASGQSTGRQPSTTAWPVGNQPCHACDVLPAYAYSLLPGCACDPLPCYADSPLPGPALSLLPGWACVVALEGCAC